MRPESSEPPAPLAIPEAGLGHVLRAWIGRGQLVRVLNQLADDQLPRDWRPDDTQLRADLMLLLDLVPYLARLPDSARRWIDLLPAQSRRRQLVADTPSGATSWVETRRRFGWPPSAFVDRRRERVPHELLTSALAWVSGEVLRLARRAATVDAAATETIAAQLDSFAVLRDIGLVEVGAGELRPSELAAVAREGADWRRLVDVARRIKAASAPELAAELLLPVAELRPTLFQLGVLGELLIALKADGAEVTSTSPLSFVTGREQFHVDHGGRRWHLWMEAGGCWQRYGAESPYRAVTTAFKRQTRPLAPDLLLIRPGEAAFVVECKYSANPDYVGRTGLAQTLLYMSDIGASLANRVEGVVVAPDDVVGEATSTETPLGRLGIATSAMAAMRAVAFLTE